MPPRTPILLIISECDIVRKTWKGRKQTNMEEGQSGTYLRQTRASSGRQVSIAKTYRDETKQFNQITVAFLSSLLYSTVLLRKATVIWQKYSLSFCFISICLSNAHSPARQHSRLSQVSAALSPFHFCLLIISE